MVTDGERELEREGRAVHGGAMTGPGAVKVEPSWVKYLEYQYQEAKIPVFEKDSLRPLLSPGAEQVREWPDLIENRGKGETR